MLVKYFHTNKPAVLFVLPLVLAVLWAPFYLYHTQPEARLVSPFVLLFKKDLLLDGLPGMAAAAITCLASAMLLNRIVINSDLSSKPTYIFAFCYVLAETFLRTDAGFYTWQISQLLMILALWPLLRIFNQRHVIDLGFEAGLLTGLAVLFYPPCLPFFLIIYFFLQWFRPFSWREWLFPLLGLVLVGLFYWAGSYIARHPPLLVYVMPHFDFTAFYFSLQGSLTALGLLLVIALTTYLRASVRASIQARKQRFLVFYLFVLFVVTLTLLNLNGISSTAYPFTCFQTALFTGFYFGYSRNRWLAECLFLLCCLVILGRFSV